MSEPARARSLPAAHAVEVPGVKPTLTPTTRLDQLDAEALRDVIGSAPFALVQKRIASELERARTVCETCKDTIELYRAQGAALALRAVLGIPANLLAEMKKQAKP